jgi:hypothetical protein
MNRLLFVTILIVSRAGAHQVHGTQAVASCPQALNFGAALQDGVCITPSIYDHPSVMETLSTMNVITIESGGPKISSFAPKNPPISQQPPPPPPPSRRATLEVALFLLSIAPLMLGKNDQKPVSQTPTKPTTRKYAMAQLVSFAPIFFGPNDGKPIAQIPPKPQPQTQPSGNRVMGFIDAGLLRITSRAIFSVLTTSFY